MLVPCGIATLCIDVATCVLDLVAQWYVAKNPTKQSGLPQSTPITIENVVVQPTYICSTCTCKLPEIAFSLRQLKRVDADRRCCKCIEVLKRIGPIYNAHWKNICAYCKLPVDNLTKEHIVPKSQGGTYSVKIVCRQCNNDRGTNMDYPPFKYLVKAVPELLHIAQFHAIPTNNSAVDATVKNILQQNVVNNKDHIVKVLRQLHS